MEEKEYFKSFNRGRITQILTNEIANRLSNWYPFNNYETSDNLLHYGTLYNTSQVDVVEVEEEVIAKLIDHVVFVHQLQKQKKQIIVL